MEEFSTTKSDCKTDYYRDRGLVSEEALTYPVNFRPIPGSTVPTSFDPLPGQGKNGCPTERLDGAKVGGCLPNGLSRGGAV